MFKILMTLGPLMMNASQHVGSFPRSLGPRTRCGVFQKEKKSGCEYHFRLHTSRCLDNGDCKFERFMEGDEIKSLNSRCPISVVTTYSSAL